MTGKGRGVLKGWRRDELGVRMQTSGLWHGKELRRWWAKSLLPLCSQSLVQSEKLRGEISKAITTFNWANSGGAVTAVSRGTLLNVHYSSVLSHTPLLILHIFSLSLWHLTPPRVRCRQLGLHYYLKLYLTLGLSLICAALFSFRASALRLFLLKKSEKFPQKRFCVDVAERQLGWFTPLIMQREHTDSCQESLDQKYLWIWVAFKLLLMTNFSVII